MKRRVLTIAGALIVAMGSALIWFSSASAVPAATPPVAAPVDRPADAPLLLGPVTASGKITLLRVHDVGTSYGPGSDFIDVEVVITLNTQPGKAFGFQLRNDAQRAARQGQLDLLRDAFNNNWTVSVDYTFDAGKNNGLIIRTWLTKP